MLKFNIRPFVNRAIQLQCGQELHLHELERLHQVEHSAKR